MHYAIFRVFFVGCMGHTQAKIVRQGLGGTAIFHSKISLDSLLSRDRIHK